MAALASSHNDSCDVDIYADIVDYSHDEVERLLATCRRLHADNQRLLGVAAELRARLTEQERSRRMLRRSFSSLMLTARAEIARKDARLEELQRLLDGQQVRCAGGELSQLVHREARRLASEWGRLSRLPAPETGPTTDAQRRRRRHPRRSNVVASMDDTNVTVQAANLSFSLATDQVPWSRHRTVQLASPRRRRRHPAVLSPADRGAKSTVRHAPQSRHDSQQTETTGRCANAKTACHSDSVHIPAIERELIPEIVSEPVMPAASVSKYVVTPRTVTKRLFTPEPANVCVAAAETAHCRFAMLDKTSDRLMMPDNTSEHLEMSDTTSDRSAVPDGTSERPVMPDRTSERSAALGGTSERSMMPDGTSEYSMMSHGISDCFLLRDGTSKLSVMREGADERAVASSPAAVMSQAASEHLPMPKVIDRSELMSQKSDSSWGTPGMDSCHVQASDAANEHAPSPAPAGHHSPSLDRAYLRSPTSEPVQRHNRTPSHRASGRRAADSVLPAAVTGVTSRPDSVLPKAASGATSYPVLLALATGATSCPGSVLPAVASDDNTSRLGSLPREAGQSGADAPTARKRCAKRFFDSEESAGVPMAGALTHAGRSLAKKGKRVDRDAAGTAVRRKRPRKMPRCGDSEADLIIDVQFCVASADVHPPSGVPAPAIAQALAPTVTQSPAAALTKAPDLVPVPTLATDPTSTSSKAPPLSSIEASAPAKADPVPTPTLAPAPTSAPALTPVAGVDARPVDRWQTTMGQAGPPGPVLSASDEPAAAAFRDAPPAQRFLAPQHETPNSPRREEYTSQPPSPHLSTPQSAERQARQLQSQPSDSLSSSSLRPGSPTALSVLPTVCSVASRCASLSPTCRSACSPSSRCSSPSPGSPASSGTDDADIDTDFQLNVDLTEDDLDYEPDSPVRGALPVVCRAGPESTAGQTSVCPDPDRSSTAGDRAKSPVSPAEVMERATEDWERPSSSLAECRGRSSSPPAGSKERRPGALAEGRRQSPGSPAKDRRRNPSPPSEDRRLSPSPSCGCREQSSDLPAELRGRCTISVAEGRRRSTGPVAERRERPGPLIRDNERSPGSPSKNRGRSYSPPPDASGRSPSSPTKRQGRSRSPADCRELSPGPPAEGRGRSSSLPAESQSSRQVTPSFGPVDRPAAADDDSAIEEGEIVDDSPVKLSPQRATDDGSRPRWPVVSPPVGRRLDWSYSEAGRSRLARLPRVPATRDEGRSSLGWRRARGLGRGWRCSAGRTNLSVNSDWHWMTRAEQAKRRRRSLPEQRRSPADRASRTPSPPRRVGSVGRGTSSGKRRPRPDRSEEQPPADDNVQDQLFTASARPTGSPLRSAGRHGRLLSRYLDAFITNQPYCEDSVSRAEPPAEDSVSRAKPPAEDSVSRAKPPAEDNASRTKPLAEDSVSRAKPPAEDSVSRAKPPAEDSVSRAKLPAETASTEPAVAAVVPPSADKGRRRRRRAAVKLGDSECVVLTVAAEGAREAASRPSESPDSLERLAREAEGCGVPDLLTGEDSEMSLLSFCR